MIAISTVKIFTIMMRSLSLPMTPSSIFLSVVPRFGINSSLSSVAMVTRVRGVVTLCESSF